MDPIDKLLAEVQADYQQPKTSKPTPKPASQPTKSSQSFIKNHGLNDLLSQVKSELDESDRLEAKKRAKQLKQIALKQEQIRKEKQARLTKQARDWLKNLDSLSDEGFWFEQFAHQFPTRLDAAIAYLDAMGAQPNC